MLYIRNDLVHLSSLYTPVLPPTKTPLFLLCLLTKLLFTLQEPISQPLPALVVPFSGLHGISVLYWRTHHNVWQLLVSHTDLLIRPSIS